MPSEARRFRAAVRKVARRGEYPGPTAILRELGRTPAARQGSGPHLSGRECRWREEELVRLGWRKRPAGGDPCRTFADGDAPRWIPPGGLPLEPFLRAARLPEPGKVVAALCEGMVGKGWGAAPYDLPRRLFASLRRELRKEIAFLDWPEVDRSLAAALRRVLG